MTEHARDCYVELLNTVRVLSPSQYSIDGNLFDRPGGDPGGAVYNVLSSYLAQDLYRLKYCRPTPTNGSRRADTRQFIAALSDANSGRGTWESGWVFHDRKGDGRIVVAKGDLKFWVYPAGVMFDAEQASIGSSCRVWVLKEIRQLIRGFYCAIGDRPNNVSPGTENRTVRIYFHIGGPSGAIEFVRLVTSFLNRGEIPFRAKVISNPAGFDRADAGVVYVDRPYWHVAAPLIRGVHEGLRAHLRDTIPMFTARVASGLALAEDPGSGESFGQSRCKVIAKSLTDSFGLGIVSMEERLERLELSFLANNIDFDAPYRSQGSNL